MCLVSKTTPTPGAPSPFWKEFEPVQLLRFLRRGSVSFEIFAVRRLKRAEDKNSKLKQQRRKCMEKAKETNAKLKEKTSQLKDANKALREKEKELKEVCCTSRSLCVRVRQMGWPRRFSSANLSVRTSRDQDDGMPTGSEKVQEVQGEKPDGPLDEGVQNVGFEASFHRGPILPEVAGPV